MIADTITDQDGRYRVYGIPPQRFGVYAEQLGYERAGVWIDSPNGDAAIDLELKRAP